MNILFVDLTTGATRLRPLADPLAGGRLLTAQLITELVDPHTDPLGPANVLVFAAGALAGRRVSTAGRLSVGGLSPLTRGIKEANAGGMAGDSLAHLGYRALVLSGACPADAPASSASTRTASVFLTRGRSWAWATRRWPRHWTRSTAPTTSSWALGRPASSY